MVVLSGLCVRVATDDWITDLISIGIGVPQGCTASTINFDVAFQPLLDYHSFLVGNIGYRIKSTILVSKPTYADDVALVTSSAADCQSSVTAFGVALDWTQTLKLNVSKCRSLAYRMFQQDEKTIYTKFQQTVYSAFDPLLKVGAESFKFIGHDEMPLFKYLGKKFQVDFKVNLIVSELTSKLKAWLQLVDGTLLTSCLLKVCLALAYL